MDVVEGRRHNWSGRGKDRNGVILDNIYIDTFILWKLEQWTNMGGILPPYWQCCVFRLQAADFERILCAWSTATETQWDPIYEALCKINKELRCLIWILLIPCKKYSDLLSMWWWHCLSEMQRGRLENGSSWCHIWHLRVENWKQIFTQLSF